jgi:hypothetical protein
MKRLSADLIFFSLLLALPAGVRAGDVVISRNPDSKRLPSLRVYNDDKFSRGKVLTMIAATFPNVPNFTCDSWCYESAVDFLDARAMDGGKVQLRHRLQDPPHAIVVTTVTPEPGAIEFLARLTPAEDADGKLPASLPGLNLCWQLRHAPAFASKPEPYPEFVKRCFICTEKGVTFLDKTVRRPIPVRSSADPYNNPPWVQMYVGAGQAVPKSGQSAWADYSSDRYTATVIGTVSRDRKYLAALANDSADTMCQAWHDCMHNNPQWLPATAPVQDRVWRLKVYAMENDPAALLARVLTDFPHARRPR